MLINRNRHREFQYSQLQFSKDSDDDDEGEETELFVRKTTVYKEIPTEDKIVEDGDTLQSLSIRYHCPDASTTDNKAAVTNVIDSTLLEDKLINLNASAAPANDDFNAVIFNSNINKTCDIQDQGVDVSDDVVEEEEVQLLPNQPIHDEVLPSPAVTRLRCSGADADISWIALIICVVILIFAVPLVYVFYIAEHPDEYHHKPHANLT